MLYRVGVAGTTLDDLADSLRITRKDHLKTRLSKLDEDKLILHHPKTGRYHITTRGSKDVEQRRLANPT